MFEKDSRCLRGFKMFKGYLMYLRRTQDVCEVFEIFEEDSRCLKRIQDARGGFKMFEED